MKIHFFSAMKYIFILFAFYPAITFAGQADIWLKQMTLEASVSTPVRDIPGNAFFEVGLSKSTTAEHWLESKAVIALGEHDFNYFSHGSFECLTPKSPYLIRAAYMNGGTGKFILTRYGTNILVAQGSLGQFTAEHRSALVVCLDFQPTHVFSSLSAVQ